MTGVPQAKRRIHKSPEDELDASILKLGNEFQNCPCLVLGEVGALLEEREASLRSTGITPSGVFNKCKGYANLYSRLVNKESIASLKASFLEMGLEPFEAAAIINLCPESVDEVRALIPSLRERLGDSLVQRIVEDLGTMLRLQS